jgi:predicted transcriptional regulator
MTMHIHVGDSFADTKRRVLDAVARAERGEAAEPEYHLSVPDWPTFFRLLTPNRIDVLRCVRAQEPRSVLALAKALGRDYRRTHEDVQALLSAGLLSRRGEMLTTECVTDRADIEAPA